MSYKNDPVFSDPRQVEMDNLDIVPYIRSVSLIRGILSGVEFKEAPVDEDGLPVYGTARDSDHDLTIPGAYIPLRGYAHLVQELHAQGYRLVKGADRKPYFPPL